MSTIPYYWINPKGRAYWRPNKRMRSLGFGCVSLGIAGEEAEQEARSWNARWQQVRKEDPASLGARGADQAPGKPSTQHYIYFLQIGDRIKIGISHRPLKRLDALAYAAPSAIKRAVIVTGSRNDERRLHDRFKAYRTRGEWFVLSRPILLTMTRCAAAGHVVHDGDRARTETVPGVEVPPDFGVESETADFEISA